MKMIQIIIEADILVYGYVTTRDGYMMRLLPACETHAEATTIDGQVKNVLNQALNEILRDELR